MKCFEELNRLPVHVLGLGIEKWLFICKPRCTFHMCVGCRFFEFPTNTNLKEGFIYSKLNFEYQSLCINIYIYIINNIRLNSDFDHFKLARGREDSPEGT